MINNRRYQTLPNLKGLARRRSREREENPRVFEGLFASLSGTNFLSKYGAGGSYGRRSSRRSNKDNRYEDDRSYGGSARNINGLSYNGKEEDKRRYSSETYRESCYGQDERRRHSHDSYKYNCNGTSRNNYEYLRDKSILMGSNFFREEEEGISFVYRDFRNESNTLSDHGRSSVGSCEDLQTILSSTNSGQEGNYECRRVLGRRETRELCDSINKERIFAYGEYVGETPKKIRVYGRNEEKKKFAVRRLLNKEKMCSDTEIENINDISRNKKFSDPGLHNGDSENRLNDHESDQSRQEGTGVSTPTMTGCKENSKFKLSLPDLSNRGKVRSSYHFLSSD